MPHIVRAIFWWKPHRNWTCGSRDIATFSDAQNSKIQRKLNAIYNWLYLKINMSEFRLILLDHITYVDVVSLAQEMKTWNDSIQPVVSQDLAVQCSEASYIIWTSLVYLTSRNGTLWYVTHFQWGKKREMLLKVLPNCNFWMNLIEWIIWRLIWDEIYSIASFAFHVHHDFIAVLKVWRFDGVS